MKRFFDFICSLLAIILLSPVLLLLSMVILIDSGRRLCFGKNVLGLIISFLISANSAR